VRIGTVQTARMRFALTGCWRNVSTACERSEPSAQVGNEHMRLGNSSCALVGNVHKKCLESVRKTRAGWYLHHHPASTGPNVPKVTSPKHMAVIVKPQQVFTCQKDVGHSHDHTVDTNPRTIGTRLPTGWKMYFTRWDGGLHKTSRWVQTLPIVGQIPHAAM
jgi:hypothetical protein